MKKYKIELNTEKKMILSLIIAILLALGLCVSTFALVYEIAFVENNIFTTGMVDINLNDGKSIIKEDEFLFEPGITVEKDFFIENNSTWDVYYKIYFADLEGSLANILEITIKDGDKVLYKDTASELTRNGVLAADDMLKIGEKRNLTISFHYPEVEGNRGQGKYMAFSIGADAVQTKNNPSKLFK